MKRLTWQCDLCHEWAESAEHHGDEMCAWRSAANARCWEAQAKKYRGMAWWAWIGLVVNVVVVGAVNWWLRG